MTLHVRKDMKLKLKVKVKVTLYPPGQVLTATGGQGSQNVWTSGARRWQGCQPHAPAAFTSSRYSWYSFWADRKD